MNQLQVRRIFTEKKAEFAIEADQLCADLRSHLGIDGLQSVRIVNRYDVAGLDQAAYQQSLITVFSEPAVDLLYEEQLPTTDTDRIFAMEYLPGQYDQRADSTAQCLQILTEQERPLVRSAKVVILTGTISDDEFAAIQAYCINPVESRAAELVKPDSLELETIVPENVAVIDGFIAMDSAELAILHEQLGLAMSQADWQFCQTYFAKTEQRDPSLTEIRVIDTYWSDHCRHTTFLTEITELTVADSHYTEPVKRAYNAYLQARKSVYHEQQRPITLMDLAVIAMKQLRQDGKLTDLDESEEINACSIVVDANVDYGQGPQREPWLVMFKNETHNHPTEIEPFGGAATCLGGAIRDPLSGRAYVYQAMRVSGSADPRMPLEQTLPGKLPQRKITLGAWAGYSSYGNQIGVATGQVAEVYDPGFVAKRMEVGAVIGAVPKTAVKRLTPVAGDVVLLVGGRTGRDGCGGATGSSKEHTADSLMTCGAEVQKGNPVTERKIQRLFRNPTVSCLIKKCNDFGAGGVAVAIGELAAGLTINLDAVPKKYDGLDGTELAISESQERMAVVVAATDVEQFLAAAAAENVEATPVATVTAQRRLIMQWRDCKIVDISRDFLDTNGVSQTAAASVSAPIATSYFRAAVATAAVSWQDAWLNALKDLNVCSQRGMIERFDSTVGANTVLMPLGGSHQDTPAEGMAATLPVVAGTTTTTTLMTYGYNPQLASWSPFHGALYAVIEAVTKIAVMGGDFRQVRLSLQEYFEKLGKDKHAWGKPLAALLGAYWAQHQLSIPAIGGKDSMSGTFMDLTVPPTLIAFAVSITAAEQVLSPEFKRVGSQVILLPVRRTDDEIIDFEQLTANLAAVAKLSSNRLILAAQSVRQGGLAAAVSKMSFGNRIGIEFDQVLTSAELVAPNYGSVILELPAELDPTGYLTDVEWLKLGVTTEQATISIDGALITLDAAYQAWTQPLADVFTLPRATDTQAVKMAQSGATRRLAATAKIAKPRVVIPVFPGTNCEYESAAAFTGAGALVETVLIRNLTPQQIEQSVEALAAAIARSQIVMLPGGFSAGDEPEGSGKFIAVMFRNPYVVEAVRSLLQQRDGLMLGICNGFQALIKLGLVPYGDIIEPHPAMPTLTYNGIGRHISRMVTTRITSVASPWLAETTVGALHTIPVSHGEGRFVAANDELNQLLQTGQIVAQYVDDCGQPTMDPAFNPNASLGAVEALCSPDGRILGKMGHSERIGSNIAVNVPGAKNQGLFTSGVRYFS